MFQLRTIFEKDPAIDVRLTGAPSGPHCKVVGACLACEHELLLSVACR